MRSDKQSYREIERYQSKMRSELRVLKNKTFNAANNNAGSNYHNALSNEMSAVSEKYKIYIELESRKIEDYRSEIGSLKE